MRWRFSNSFILRDKRELIIRLDLVYYNTRGSKVGLRKIGTETAKISRNIDPSDSYRGSPSVCTTIVIARASVDRRGAAGSSPIHVVSSLYSAAIAIVIHAVSVLRAAAYGITTHSL